MEQFSGARMTELSAKWAFIAGPTSESIADNTHRLAANGYSVVLFSTDAFDLTLLAKEVDLKYSIQTKVIFEDNSDPASLRRILNDLHESGIRFQYMVNKLWTVSNRHFHKDRFKAS